MDEQAVEDVIGGEQKPFVKKYEGYWTLETRGTGLIHLMTCSRCGAVVVLGEEQIHDDWHKREIARQTGSSPKPPSDSESGG